ncbi:zinc finger BED domain-containing protein RICESLEEPER 2-like [Neltuma alba]|uniref:zinc finger BED domain-containing protein RICESLEEPER 2-like n=1 Tax=Neltuma alba TaxID=207710 RepID=UPI0010A4BC71|nr:zinc finger BED domain-containing protein RICESLEEPER 2-like [Prosopis alba]
MPPPDEPFPPPPPTAIDLVSNSTQDKSGDNVSRKRKELEKKSTKSQVWEHFVKLPLEETNGEVKAAADIVMQLMLVTQTNEDDDYEASFARGSKNEGPLKASDWNKARMFLQFLKVFYDITLMFSSSLNVTSNTWFHRIALIHELLEENIVNANPLLMEMSLSMRKVCMAMKINIRDVLYHMFDEYSMGQASSSTSSNVSSVPLGSSTSAMPKGQGSRDLGHRRLASQKEKSSSDPQSELDRYLSSSSADDTPVDDDFDMLAWWRANSSKYKIISRMAHDVLAVPMSTVASESAFSIGGCVVDSYRSSLSPTMTKALICAQNWLLLGKSLSEFASMLQEFDNF